MTNSEKREWLDWATEQGFIECEVHNSCNHWYVNSLKGRLVANEIGGRIEFYSTFMLVLLDWVDEKGWLLRQLDIRENSRVKTFRATIELYSGHMIGGQFGFSRVEALMKAFREAVGGWRES